MGKKVRVAMWGRHNRSIMVDSDATKGATLGKDIFDEDGDLVTLESITNYITNIFTGTDPRSVFPTLWELILNIPAIIQSLVALTTDGWIRNNGGVISAQEVGYTKNSVATGESATIPEGHQALVWDSFTLDGGSLTLDGDLVILGADISGGGPSAYVTKAINYTITPDDHTVVATVTGLTFTLPPVAGLVGKEYILKLSVVGDLTIEGDGSEKIDDGLTAVLETQYESITVICNGTGYDII